MIQDINVDLKNLNDLKCEDCKGYLFMPVFKVKVLPALISSSGKEELIPIQVLVCTSCGSVHSKTDKI